MTPARLLLVTLSVVIAGCLEEPGVTPVSPEPTPEALPLDPTPVDEVLDNVTDVLDDTDEPEDEANGTSRTNETDEARDGDVFFDGAPETGADFVLVDVPEGYAELGLFVAANGSLAGEVRLRNPDGEVLVSCSSTCEAAYTGTIAPGEWVLLFPSGTAGLEVRVVGRVEAAPPPPPPTERTRHLVYSHSQDLSAHVPGMRDTFALVEGYDRLVLDVKLTSTADGFELLLHDPSGAERGRCDVAQTRCTVDVESPPAGLWMLRYGANAAARADVTAHGIALADVDYPNNVSALDLSFGYSDAPRDNYTYGLFVAGPYQGLHFFVDLQGEGSPYVTLVDPTGAARAVCGLTWNTTACPTAHAAQPGRWTVVMHGTGPAEANVDVWLAPDAPPPPPPPPGDGPGEPYVAYENVFTFSGPANRTDRVSVTSTTARLTGTISLDVGAYDDAAVEIRDPGWKTIFRCAGSMECPVDLSLTWSQPHYILYVGSGAGTAEVELVYSEETATRPEPGMYFQAYGGAHNYHSWGDRRGPFADGFTVPPGWTRVVANVSLNEVAADDATATARITLVGPDGADVASCARPSRHCLLDVPAAAPGMWEVRYDGVDASTDARVQAYVHAA